MAKPRIWFDVQDLLDYAQIMPRPSGIQRVCLELYAAMVALAPNRIGFVRHGPGGAGLQQIAWEELRDIFPHQTPPPSSVAKPAAPQRSPLRSVALWLASHLPDAVRLPLGNAAQDQMRTLRLLCRAAHAARPKPAALTGAVQLGPDLLDAARPGDVIAAFGSPWSHPDHAGLLGGAARQSGMRVAALVHDLIPVVRPEFYEVENGALFARHMRATLPAADIVMTVSHATARDVVAWARRKGLVLRDRPRPIPIGTGFTHPPVADLLPPGLSAGGYALFVSTIEARKNHILAFRAWRRLLEELPADQVPTLVFAGRTGWMVADLMQQIQNAGHLGGKLVHVESPDDATLAALYQGARFTLFPSLYEGWGLPVSESLSFGKVCLAASTTSVPEAGGEFCLYHDPDSVTDAVALYRRAITEPGLIPSLEARIRAEYRPTPWSATARAVLDALG